MKKPRHSSVTRPCKRYYLTFPSSSVTIQIPKEIEFGPPCVMKYNNNNIDDGDNYSNIHSMRSTEKKSGPSHYISVIQYGSS